MEARINVAKLNSGGYKVMYGFTEYLAKSSLDKKLIDMIHLRVSQINGWNRLNIAFRTPAGTYQPGQFDKLKSA